MKRIQRLHLRNFKAFHDQVFDFTGGKSNDTEGRHVLIYGGNGSGKSSVYWALYTLFEASRKDDVGKYFADPNTEPQSLRYADATDADPSFVKINWYDPSPPLDPTTGEPDPAEKAGECTISSTQNSAINDRFIREADTASDFVNYRLFQHFNGSNRDAVNIWPAFVRDIFPYYDLGGSNADFEDASGNQPDYLGAITVLVKQLRISRQAWTLADEAKLAAAEPRPEIDPEALGDDVEAYLPDLDQAAQFAEEYAAEQNSQFTEMLSAFNQAVNTFIGRIAGNANRYLQDLASTPGHVHQSMRLQIKYARPLSTSQVAALADDIDPDRWVSFLRRDEPAILSIELRVWTERTDRSVLVERPQTFLNEARLSRLAFALRMGALLDRNPGGRFNILCLDDVLLSLDMSNRLEVLDWLFSPQTQVSGSATPRLLNHYQVFFFTHDLELYGLVKHYIESRDNADNWYNAQLTMHTHTNGGQPLLFHDGDDLSRAKMLFGQGQYAACATELRKITEKQLENFLPNSCSKQGRGPQIGKSKDLNGFIQALEGLYGNKSMELGKSQFSPFSDLMLYKNFHLNPLSHHHALPLVMQDELWRYMETVLPNLKRLQRRSEISIRQGNTKTLVDLTLPIPGGNSRVFRLYLGNEPIELLDCLITNGTLATRRVDSFCILRGEVSSAGVLQPLPSGNLFEAAAKAENLFVVWSKLYNAMGVHNADIPSVHSAQITVAS